MTTFAPSDLTVVIPTRDRWQILQRTLSALRAQSVQGFEVVVVVDGPDQTPPDLSPAQIIVKEHGGPGAARNAGVAQIHTPLVLFLGDDMIPVPQLVERHLAKHNANPAPEVAVLGLSEWHPDVGNDRIHRWLDWSDTQFDYRNITTEDAGFGRFYSSNVSLKRQFFIDAGGFDEDFTYYYEDLDAGWRMHEKGLRLLYEPAALAHHLHRIRWPDIVRRFQGIARGEFLMQRKHAWFEPFYRKRVIGAASQPPVAAWWPRVADKAPENYSNTARRRANLRYHQLLAPYFLDAWEGERDLEELRAYAGESYEHGNLVDHMGAVARELDAVGDEQEFYRSSETYLYDLTAFAMSGTKVPYREDLKRLVPAPARLLDWGCGIGADGLRFIDAGYEVSFADFDNPSTRYLKWRLARREKQAPVYDIEHDDIPGGFDAAFAFDVIEHVMDPFAFLAELEKRAAVVMVNLLEEEYDPAHPHHRELPIRKVLAHAQQRGLLLYRVYHGKSHLIAYRSTPQRGPLDIARSLTQRYAGRYLPTT